MPLHDVSITQASGFTYGTTPPTNPAESHIWVFPADDTNGVEWMFRYHPAETTYKWRFIGGSPMQVTVNTDESTATANAWADLATVGPAISPGRAGDYLCFGQASTYGIGGGNASYIGVANGATTPGGSASLLDNSGTAASIPGFYARIGGIASGDSLRMRYFHTAAGTGHWTGRILSVWPIRVI